MARRRFSRTGSLLIMFASESLTLLQSSVSACLVDRKLIRALIIVSLILGSASAANQGLEEAPSIVSAS